MNKLDIETRSRILHLLCKGQSILAVTATMGMSKNTVSKLLVDAGKACFDYHDQNVHSVKAQRVRLDAIWSFTSAKQKNVETAVGAPEGVGDTWTWTALDTDSRLVMSYLVGGRDDEYAMAFMDDVASRLASRVQMTTDGHCAYLEVVEDAFGCSVDYAQHIENYGAAPESAKGRYSSAECIGARKGRVEDNPDLTHVSMSYVDCQNLTMRMHTRRFTRMTNGFSKKVENHAYVVALHFMYYNFVCIHKTLRISPAMAAGISGRLWEMRDIAALVEDAEAKRPVARGPYKARGQLSN